jgi:hypothetical protein
LEPEFQFDRPRVIPQPKFEARWLEEDQCDEIVQNAWNLALLLGDSLVSEAIKKVGERPPFLEP